MKTIKQIYRAPIDWVPTISFLLAGVLWQSDYSTIGLYVATPAAIALTYFVYKKNMFKSMYWKLLAYTLFFIVASTLLVSDGSFKSLMMPIVATVLLCESVYTLAIKGQNIKILSLAYVMIYLYIMYATLTGNAFVVDFDYADERDRATAALLNSNIYAYFSLFAIMAGRVLMGPRIKCNSIILLAIYLFMAVCSCYTGLMVASRQIMLLEIPLIAYFVYMDFFVHGKSSGRLMFLLLIAGVVFVGIPFFMSYYSNSYLAVRAETTVDEDSRFELIMEAITLGLKNPIFGVGLGANVHFSHCTYTHLLSRCGVIPAILYIILIYKAVMVQYKRFRVTRDYYFQILFVCAALFAIANFFYVYIDQPFMLPVIFLLIGESDRYASTKYNI